MRKRVLCLLFLGSVLLGCGRKQPQQLPLRLVSEITVVYENTPIHFYRQYTSTEKMRQVLNYLRLIDPKTTANIDPNTISGGQYTITLLYSDGTQRIYRQKSDTYMQVDAGPWKRIDPKKAEWLSQLIEKMESDYA